MAKQCRYNIMSEQQINHRIHWPPWVIRDHRTGEHNDASAKRQTSKKLQPTARANQRLHGRIILRTHCFSNLSPVVLVSSVVLTPPMPLSMASPPREASHCLTTGPGPKATPPRPRGNCKCHQAQNPITTPSPPRRRQHDMLNIPDMHEQY